MTRDRVSRLAQSAGCLLCAILLWHYTFRLDGTEFSGGRNTGPLLDMANFGILLFAVALILGFLRTRLAAAVALLASLLTLPLYFYFTCPGPFRRVFKGDYSVPARADFVWDVHSIVGMTALTLTAILSLRNLMARQPKANS